MRRCARGWGAHPGRLEHAGDCWPARRGRLSAGARRALLERPQRPGAPAACGSGRAAPPRPVAGSAGPDEWWAPELARALPAPRSCLFDWIQRGQVRARQEERGCIAGSSGPTQRKWNDCGSIIGATAPRKRGNAGRPPSRRHQQGADLCSSPRTLTIPQREIVQWVLRLGRRGRTRLVQSLPPAADPLGQESGHLSGLPPAGSVPDHLPQGAPCRFTFWIGRKAPLRRATTPTAPAGRSSEKCSSALPALSDTAITLPVWSHTTAPAHKNVSGVEVSAGGAYGAFGADRTAPENGRTDLRLSFSCRCVGRSLCALARHMRQYSTCPPHPRQPSQLLVVERTAPERSLASSLWRLGRMSYLPFRSVLGILRT